MAAPGNSAIAAPGNGSIAAPVGKTTAAPARAAMETDENNQSPQYANFTFPSQAPVAKIMYSIGLPPFHGQKRVVRERVLAQGKVRLPTNIELSIDLCYDSLDHMDSLTQLSRCRVVNLTAASLDFEDKHLLYLLPFKGLSSINLKDTLVTDKSLPQLVNFPLLRVVRLDKTNVTGTGFDSLTKLQDLRDISMEGINLKPGTIAKLKPVAAKLTAFNIARTGLTKADAAFIKALKITDILVLNNDTQIDNDCVDYLTHLKSLKDLSIADTSITETCIPLLLRLPSLRLVKVRDSKFWTSKQHKTTYGHMQIADIEHFSTIPADFCITPLH